MDDRERVRLEALRSYKILDTEPEKAFDDLVLLASQICEAPVALISLVDENRQWFKSRVGISVAETSRKVSFCAHAIQRHEVMEVPDALEDERFRDNPLVVGEPHIRFYTGAPLITAEGHGLGTLCVVDYRPRRLSSDQKEALQALQRQAVAQLELRRNLRELEAALAERDRAERGRERLIEDLRTALANVKKLAGLIPASSSCLLDVTVPADLRQVPTIRDGVMQIVRDKHCAAGHEIEVEVALQEALVNAIKHGCRNDASQHVQCCVTCDANGEVLIVVRDPGSGFDVASVPDPLSDQGLLRESGRGVFLINELMDEVRYEDGGREIRMRKRGRATAEKSGQAPF